MTDLRLFGTVFIFGSLLAITVGQFGFPGMGGRLPPGANLGGRPFLVQRGGGPGAGYNGLQRFGGGGFAGAGRAGGFGRQAGAFGGFFPRPTTTAAPTTTQNPRLVADMIAKVVSTNYEYHLTHDKEGHPINATIPGVHQPKKLNRIEAIKRAVMIHNLRQ